MKMIRIICLVLCLLPVNVFGQENNDSNIDNKDIPKDTTSDLPSQPDPAPPVKDIESAVKLTKETAKSWTPIFESCVPDTYNQEVYIRIKYDEKGNIVKISPHTTKNMEIFNCLKDRISEIHFNIDVSKLIEEMDICHCDYGTIAIKYKNHSLTLGSDTAKRPIGWQYTKCACIKSDNHNGCGSWGEPIAPVMTHKQYRNEKDAALKKRIEKYWSLSGR